MEIAFNQTLLLLLQCSIVALLLASLFRLRSIFGLGLLYIALGVFQFLQVFLASSLLVEIASGIFISTGSMVLFSASLFMVLVIYIREDALETRKIIYAILAANLVTSLLLIVFGWSIDNEVVVNLHNLPEEFFSTNARILVIGTVIFIFDAFAIIFIYEFISKYVKPLFFRILFTMTLVLSLDSIFFALGIFYDKLEIQNIVISALISKTLAAIIYSGLFTLYLVYFDTKSIKSESKADTFKDIFHKLTFRQKYDDVFTEMKNKSIELEEAQQIAKLGSYILDLKKGVWKSSLMLDELLGINKDYKKDIRGWIQLIHPEDQEMMNEYFTVNVLTDHEKFDKEYRIVSFNEKHVRWVHDLGELEFNHAGEPFKLIGTVQDITKQKLAEKKLQESEDRFQMFANASFEGIGMAVDGIIMDVNKRLTELTGYSREELIDHPLLMLIHPDDKRYLINNIKNGYEGSSEFRILRKDHTIQYVESRGRNIRFNGKNTRIVNLYDISDRMEIAEKLTKSEEKFSKAYFNNPIPIFISSIPDGEFIDINPKFEEVSGHNRKELIGNKVTDLEFYVNEQDRFKLFKELDNKGRLEEYEIGFKVKSGQIRDCKMHSEIIDIDGGACLISILIDITEQKQSKLALEKQNKELITLSTELSNKHNLLIESERKFKNLFDKNPVSLWEEDFSVVKQLLNKKLTEISDLKQYLDENPDFVLECVSKVEILHVNNITLDLFGLNNTEELTNHLSKTFNDKSFEIFKKELLAIASNKNEFSGETEFIRSDGEIITALINFLILDDNYEKAIVSIVDITELNKAKEKIEKSEIQFRELYEKSGDAILIIKNGIFTECNQATVDMLKYKTKEDFLNSHPSKLSPIFQPDGKKSFDKAIEMMDESLKKGTHRFEWIHTKNNGNNFPVEVLLTAISKVPNNEIIHCVWRDITERKQAELTLKDSERELQNSQEIAQLGTFNIDLATMRFSSSPIFDTIIGFNFEKTKKFTTYQKTVHPDDFHENQKLFENCIKTGEKFDREYRIFTKKTKKLKWIHAMGGAIYIEGKPVFFKGTIQDITDRKLNELAIKLNEKKLIEVQKIANLGTYEIDLETNNIDTSELYNSIFGIKKKPTNNIGWWKSITHPDDFERSELLWQQCIKDCTVYNDEYRIITDKNEIKWIHDIAEVKCDKGIAVKVIGTIQDITNLKLTERKIKRSDAILSQINSLVKVTDKNGSLTYASPSFKTVLGYEPDDMLGQGWWIKTTDNIKLANKVRDEVLDVVQNNNIPTNKLRNRWIKTKDGKSKLFQWTCSKGLGDSLIFIGIDITERNIAEKNSAQYWKIVENSLNEIFIFDADTLQFIEVNRGARKNIGYTSKELLKMTPLDIKPLFTKRKFIELLKPLKNGTQEKIIFTSEHRRKDGTTYKAEVDIQKSELKLKSVFIASIKDITQQQKNEQIKRIIFNITKKSNESVSLEELFNFTKIELGKLINTNNFFVALYDEKTEMISTPYMVDELDTASDFPKGKTLTGHVIDTKKAVLTKDPIVKTTSNSHEVIGLGPESKCWLGVPILIDNEAIGAIVVQSYTDENAYNEGDVILLELIASNIGKIIRKTKDLEQIKLLNQALINTPAIVMITNKNGELEFINTSFTNSLGYEFNEVIGKNPKFLNPKIKIKEFYLDVGKNIARKGYWKDEMINVKKNGDLIRVSASIAPVKDEDNNLSHYIIIEEDITEKRKLERQFINAIIDAQDIEKQSFGEELHDSISQILSAESMYIDLLIDQNQDHNDGKTKFLTKIKDLNSSAINEIRSIAHGLMSNQLKQSGLLISVENICIDFSNKKNIEFKFVNDGVDEKDLSQEIKTNLFRVIQELSTNINRYSNASKAIIRFSKSNKNNLKLIIKDNGIGMDYNKIINESKGIGLQTVKRRVAYLNGNFDLESALNKGTCYTLEIPL